MLPEGRIRALGVLLALAFAGVAVQVARLSCWTADETARTPFEDRQVAEAVTAALSSGAVSCGPQGAAVLDEGRLEAAIPQPGLRRLVRRQLGRVRFGSSGEPRWDPANARITDRPRQRTSLSRGRIVDRAGVPLAEGSGSRRSYPLGPDAVHVVGLRAAGLPVRGIEASFDAELAGRPRSLFRALRSGTALPAEGATVRLALDARLQRTAARALGERRGAVVALDPRTGDVLAAVSRPALDPADPYSGAWQDAGRGLGGNPLLNRAWAQRLPPGSVFKLVVAAEALEAGERGAATCTGRDEDLRIGETDDPRWTGHGEQDLAQALAASCNVAFARLAVEQGADLEERARAFGFNERPAELLPGRAASHPVTSFALAELSFEDAGAGRTRERIEARDSVWLARNPRLVAQGGLGQNIVEATPLQLALLGATLARGGRRVEPRLVLAVEHGGRSEELPVREDGRAVSASTAGRLVEMMAGAARYGTAARLPPLPGGAALAAKTGTAQVSDAEGKLLRPHAWFVGLAPAEDPSLVVVALVEHGGSGARAAGPVAHAVLSEHLSAREPGS